MELPKHVAVGRSIDLLVVALQSVVALVWTVQPAAAVDQTALPQHLESHSRIRTEGTSPSAQRNPQAL